MLVGTKASRIAQLVKNLPAMQEALGREDPLEKGKATHSSILAWRIPWGHKELDTTERLSLHSFRIDWFDLLAVQGTQECSPTPHFKSINSSALSFLYRPTLTSIHDYWKNHSFNYTDLGWQSKVSAF